MATPTTADDGPDDAPMSLEELSEVTGVAPRTIRYYQTQKLLQRPAKDATDGRLSRYGPEHVDRLALIGELHDRGLKLPAIRKLLDAGDPSARIADWLGLDDSLRGSWTADSPRLVDRSELSTLLSSTPTGTQGHFEHARLIVRQGNAWLIPNPALLDLTIGLVAEGIRTDLVLEAGSILEQHLGKAAEQLIDLFVKALGEGFGHGADTASLVNSLRPVAGDAARMIFGRQLEAAVESLLADTKRLNKL